MTTEEENALLKVVSLLAHEGIPTTVSKQGNMLIASFVDGFYKSDGLAFLKVENGRLYLCARYNDKTEIHGIDDVIRCSREWHEHSKDRLQAWKAPPAHWAALYGRLSVAAKSR